MNYKKFFVSILFIFAALQSYSQEVIEWKFSIQDKGNGEIELVADADIQSGWHMYDSKIPDGGPFPTTIRFDEIKGAELIGEFHSVGKQAVVKYDDIFKMNIGTYDLSAKFVQRIKVTDKANFKIAGDVRAQACDDSSCTPPLPSDFEFGTSDLPATVVAASSAKTDASNAEVIPITELVPAEEIITDIRR